MIIIVFFSVVILFSLVLNAVDKILSYHNEDKSVWQDGDSVRIKVGGKDDASQEDNFMTRIA